MNKTILFFFVLACTAAAAFAYTQSDLEDAMDMMSQQQYDVQDYSDSSSSSDEEVSDLNRGFFKSIGKAFRRFTSGGLSGILGRVGGLVSGGSDLFGRIGGLVSGGRNLIGSIGGLFRSGGGSFFSKLGNVFNQGKDLFNAGRGVFQDARGLLAGPTGGVEDSDVESSDSDDEVEDQDNNMFFRSLFRGIARVARNVFRGGLGNILGNVGNLISGGSDLFGRVGGLLSGGKSFLGSIGGLFRSGGGSFFSKLGNVFNQGKDLFNAGRSIFSDAQGLFSSFSGNVEDSDVESSDSDVEDEVSFGDRPATRTYSRRGGRRGGRRSFFNKIGGLFNAFNKIKQSGELEQLAGQTKGLVNQATGLAGRGQGVYRDARGFVGTLKNIADKKNKANLLENLGLALTQGADLVNKGNALYQEGRGLATSGSGLLVGAKSIIDALNAAQAAAPAGNVEDSDIESSDDEEVQDSDIESSDDEEVQDSDEGLLRNLAGRLLGGNTEDMVVLSILKKLAVAKAGYKVAILRKVIQLATPALLERLGQNEEFVALVQRYPTIAQALQVAVSNNEEKQGNLLKLLALLKGRVFSRIGGLFGGNDEEVQDQDFGCLSAAEVKKICKNKHPNSASARTRCILKLVQSNGFNQPGQAKYCRGRN